jgi:GNAT superfamily N-acetyltransferase
MSESYVIERCDAVRAGSLVGELADLYRAVHSESGQPVAPLYGRQAFVDRTERQLQRDGFSLVCARDPDGVLIGFCFGVPLGPGAWWTGAATQPPEEVIAAPKFAVIEIVVRQDRRGNGVGRRLMDDLLTGRPEPYAILTTRAEAPARNIYAHWGWEQVGTAQHAPDAPVMDQLVLRR